MAKEVYWHLPGFYANFYLYQVLINLMKEYPDKFEEGYKVGSVYGTFPGAIWNGGRGAFGYVGKTQMKQVLDTYEKINAPVRFTWTNSLIVEKHLTDTFCNLIMRLSDNGNNQVLCNSEILERYLRDTYPDFKFVSSTTKRIRDIDTMKAELERDYFMAVLDYDLNHNEEALKELEPVADRVEILVDEICMPNCPLRTKHYESESRAQLEFDRDATFKCPNSNNKPSFQIAMSRPGFISKTEIKDYIERGYVNFKLVGRGLPEDFLIDSIMYYLVKEEDEGFIREKLSKTLFKLRGR